jgi:GNAT superfamily N-acetyltransferase
VEVRHATADDADAIARVQERGWQRAYRHVFPVEQLDRGGFIHPERWRARLEVPPPGWTTFVADDAGAVVGFACVGPNRDGSATGELYAIYVDPERWANGVGGALIERAEARLAKEYRVATLWVLEDNPRARAFYERHGWRADGAVTAEDRWGIRAPEVRYRKELA